MVTPIGYINDKPVFGPPPLPGLIPMTPSTFQTAFLSGNLAVMPELVTNPTAPLPQYQAAIFAAIEDFEVQHLVPYSLLTL